MTTNKKSKRSEKNRNNTNFNKTPGLSGGFVALKKDLGNKKRGLGTDFKRENENYSSGKGGKRFDVYDVGREKDAKLSEEWSKNAKTDSSKPNSAKSDSVKSPCVVRSGQKLPELLAPAGSPKALAAAIAAGADAVYFALPDFNARINADNFTRESFAEGVKLCHQNGVKAYITLNTQVYDREKTDLLRSALYAYRSGVDAAIVGDLGCAALIKKYIPDLEIHASTQLSGHNSPSGTELSRLGFTRMVCAREMKLSDIESFVKNSPIEAEIFVHGALCVCHSGQCLFSSLVGGRSGNRGLCAQPCRLPYRSDGDKNRSGYHLSLKDMCLASHIEEIINSGVASLKIEGRMKPAEYVFGVVSIYRRLLDERRSATNEELDSLARIFSRGGFTDRYFTDRISSDMLGVRSEKDKELSKTAADSQIGKGVRRVGITLCAEIKKDAPMKLSLSLDGATSERLCREITVEAMGDTPLIAENRPTDAQTAKKNLTKFGSTPFVVTDCEIKLDDGLMIPVSSLNALRREASDKLLSELLAPYEKRLDFDVDFKSIENIKGGLLPNGESESDKQKPQTARKTAYFARLYQVPVEASDYFDIRFLAATEFVRENAERIKALKINGIALPPVIYDSEMGEIREMLALASELGVSHALVGNLGHISLIKELGFSLFGDFRLNVSNSETASLLCSRFGFEEVLLSPELTLPRIRTISNYANVGAIVYGRIPLMIVEKCVISELTPCAYAINKKGSPCALCAADKAKLVDRTGAAFPVLREFRHRNVIFNSLPTYMADKLTELPYEDKCSRHFIFSCESNAEVSSIISAYKSNSPSAAPVRRIGV